ncbi:MAG: hypothetical protein II940_03035 [Methanosarcinaceae archaeon]|nr:hypothetical protein [Methanosarcinaceae archaeon]
MMKYLIRNADRGADEGGMACGPVGGADVAEAEFEDENGNVFWLRLAEFDGLPNFYRTDRPTFDFQIDIAHITDDDIAYLNDTYIPIGDYEDIFSNQDDELTELYRYLIWLIRCPEDYVREFIAETVGKYIGDFDIPMSEDEMDFHEFEYEDRFFIREI